MINDISGNASLPTPAVDAHGQAAMLLVESLIHGLIEKRVLSVAEAVDIVDVATEVKLESGTERGELPATLLASINLLQDISASLRFDVETDINGSTRA